MATTGSEAVLHNRFVTVGLGGPARGGLPGDDFRLNAGSGFRVVKQLLQFGLHRLLVLTRHHAAVEEQLAAVRHHVISVPPVDARHRQAGIAHQRVAATAHLLLMRLLNQAQ